MSVPDKIIRSLIYFSSFKANSS